MKKLGLIFKDVSENRIKNYLKESGSVFIVRNTGLGSFDMSTLRQSLKNAKANLFVVKNSIARRALKSSNLEGLIKLLDGSCGLIFVRDEPSFACRLLYNFSREHESIKLEGGFLKDRLLDKKDIETLARLPSREVLLTQLVMTLNAPPAKLVMVLKQTLRKFVYCLEQIKIKKGN